MKGEEKMSYVDKKDEEEKDAKLSNPLKAIFSEDTQIEAPEDIIKTDTDEKRKTAFKKAYDRIQAILPIEVDKKKKKKKEKEQEKEAFNRNLNAIARAQTESTKTIKREERNTVDKGIERD